MKVGVFQKTVRTGKFAVHGALITTMAAQALIPATPEAEAGGSQIQGLPGLQFSGCYHHFHLTKGKPGLREPKPLYVMHTATRGKV